jgi:hypothetical protein
MVALTENELGKREVGSVPSERLPPEVRSLISEHIDSVVRLEVLLHLHLAAQARGPGVTQGITAADAARELRIEPAWATRQLEDLCSRGLASCDRNVPQRFIYHPSTDRLAAAVNALVAAYVDRRVAVVAAIYAPAEDALQRFSDAFTFRKDPHKDRGGEKNG